MWISTEHGMNVSKNSSRQEKRGRWTADIGSSGELLPGHPMTHGDLHSAFRHPDEYFPANQKRPASVQGYEIVGGSYKQDCHNDYP